MQIIETVTVKSTDGKVSHISWVRWRIGASKNPTYILQRVWNPLWSSSCSLMRRWDSPSLSLLYRRVWTQNNLLFPEKAWGGQDLHQWRISPFSPLFVVSCSDYLMCLSHIRVTTSVVNFDPNTHSVVAVRRPPARLLQEWHKTLFVPSYFILLFYFIASTPVLLCYGWQPFLTLVKFRAFVGLVVSDLPRDVQLQPVSQEGGPLRHRKPGGTGPLQRPQQRPQVPGKVGLRTQSEMVTLMSWAHMYIYRFFFLLVLFFSIQKELQWGAERGEHRLVQPTSSCSLLLVSF